MRENIAEFRDVPRFRCRTKITICGYGPSLVDTWKDIDRTCPILTTSGAHGFLLERGIIPTYHAECDPRDHKVFFIRQAHRDVTYLIASICHKKMFRRLRNHKVMMWHPLTHQKDEQTALLREVEYGAHMIGGGSNAGLRALLLAFHMGFRDFDVHGLDFSYRGDQIWAGEHSGKRHQMMEATCNGRYFNTSDIMVNACEDFWELMQSPKLGGCHFAIRGEGLLSERVRLASIDSKKADDDWIAFDPHMVLSSMSVGALRAA